MTPRSTRLIGISGSCTSASAAHSLSFIGTLRVVGSRAVLVMRLAELVELLLEHRDHLRVARASVAPPHQHVVPGDRLLEIPPLRLGVELAGRGIVQLPNVLAVPCLFV